MLKNKRVLPFIARKEKTSIRTNKAATVKNVNVTLQISKFTASQHILKNIIWELKNILFWDSRKCFRQCRCKICKVQNSIILISKVGKLGWIDYIDKDVFAALTYLGFHLEHKVNKYIQMFSKADCFLAFALSLLVDHVI